MEHLLLAGYLSLFAADASTTHYALVQVPQTHELLLTQSPAVNDALFVAQAAGLWFITSKIQRPWLRWTVRFGVASVHGIAAAHNLSVIHEVSR